MLKVPYMQHEQTSPFRHCLLDQIPIPRIEGG
jgi:hypothetical protein